jgi:hypothetical protein
MARIEISLKEYNELKNTIETLENEKVEKEKVIRELNETIDELFDELDNVVNGSAFFERLFRWKTITQNAQEILEKYETK